MGAARKVIEELKTGISPEELARRVSWKDLSEGDGEDLLTVALRLGDNQQSYNLLVYLFHISFGKDLWFSTEVLSQAVQHPHMTRLDRQAILPTMRSRLDQIKDQIGTKTPTEERLTKYWLIEATYYSVNGDLLSELGKQLEATQNYQIAQSIFEQLGLFQKAAEYKALNRRLSSKEPFKSPLPKTSPIRLRDANAPTAALQGQPGETKTPAVEPPESTAPENNGSPLSETPAALVTSETDQTAAETSAALPAVEGEAASLETLPQDTTGLPAAEDQSLELTRPAAGEAISTAAITPEPKKVAEINPSIPEPGQLDELIIQLPPAEQVNGLVDAAPQDIAAEITVPAETAMPAASAPQSESPSITGIYYPLPDVWLEDGRLHILGVEKFRGDPADDLSEQIRQQSDILMGLQLQINMYQTRRKMLDQEMKQMEAKAQGLRAQIERLQSQALNLESDGGAPSI
jgi:hypothetical protein